MSPHEGPKNIHTAMYYKTNAGVLLNCHRLGYVKDTDAVCDLTYGRGVWWKTYRPPGLVTNSTNPKIEADFSYNVLRLPKAWRARFDVAVLDLPYVSVGGRKTSTVKDFFARYGMAETPKTPRQLHDGLIAPGMRSAARIVRPGGFLLQKAKNYITSGEFQPAVYWAWEEAREIGLELADEVIAIMGTGPQPRLNLDGTLREQKHFRSNYSVLLIWRKAK
jgi:hypothetical protein